MTIVFIDGIAVSGKTTLLNNVQKFLYEERSKYTNIIISEHLTERFFEDKKPAFNEVSKYINDLLNSLITLQNIHKNGIFKYKKYILNIYVERFFLTFYSRGLISESFFV